MAPSLLIYSAKVCPYAQRSLLALEEAHLAYDKFEIDLANKPSWYNGTVNEASKVPVLVINPSAPADEGAGSAASTIKVPESLVIAEWVAEAYPQTKLLPEDATQRALIRYHIERFSQLWSPAWYVLLFQQDASKYPALYTALDTLTAWLQKNGDTFFAGPEYTLFELAVAPFLTRLLLASKLGLTPPPPEDAQPIHTALKQAKFAPLQKWLDAVEARSSWTATFDTAYLTDTLTTRVNKVRAELANK